MEYSVKETASVKKLMLLLYGMAAMVVALLIGTISVYAADDDNEDGTEVAEEGTASKPKNNNMVMIIILVAIGGAAVLFMKMKNKKKKDTEATADAPIPDDEDDEDEVKDED